MANRATFPGTSKQRFHLFAAAFLLAALPTAAKACLAHYHSVDQLVADSPLIIIGEVVATEKMPKELAASPSLLDGGPSPPHEGDPQPAVATVRVLRVLQGSWKNKTIRIGSGPIGACSPWAAHYRFAKGDRAIYILPALPAKGYVCLRYQGSIRDIKKTEMVEQYIARARAHRSDYLAKVKDNQPDVYAAAGKLRGELVQAAKSWPQPRRVPLEVEKDMGAEKDAQGAKAGEKTEPAYWEKETHLTKAATKALLEQQSEEKIETLRTLMALAWQDQESKSWTEQFVWRQAVEQLKSNRAREAAESGRAYYRDILTRAGVEKKHVDSYLKELTDRDLDDAISFPVQAPSCWNKDFDGEQLTTDFILRYHLYDRGNMFQCYGMDFEELAKLQPGRLRLILPAMLGSQDEQLSLVAYRAIEYMPGTEFVEAIFWEIMREEEHYWECLVAEQPKGQAELRLRHMVKLAYEKCSGWGIASFWLALAEGSCFEPAVIGMAIEKLAKVQQSARQAKDETKEDRYREQIRRALLGYLDAAKKARASSEEPPQDIPAAEFSKWFAEHPYKNHDGEDE
ncbi:MAG: hypothetical protein ACYTF6_08105 [Planctomycetota bacterium]|jgi:hypothetical protein